MPRKTQRTNSQSKSTRNIPPQSYPTSTTTTTPSQPQNNTPSTIGSALSQGVGLGTGVALGSTLANGVANVLFRRNDNETVNENYKSEPQMEISNQNNNCFFEYNDYKKCMEENPNNINQCKLYLEMLNICRKDVIM